MRCGLFGHHPCVFPPLGVASRSCASSAELAAMRVVRLTSCGRPRGTVLSVTGWRRERAPIAEHGIAANPCFGSSTTLSCLEGFSRGRYYLNDPANGHRTVSEEEFDRAFTGVVLALEARPGLPAWRGPSGALCVRFGSGCAQLRCRCFLRPCAGC